MDSINGPSLLVRHVHHESVVHTVHDCASPKDLTL
jgi:hypothetical protein